MFLELLISSYISSSVFGTLFIKTNSSWLIFESNKALEIRTFTLSNFNFANNSILSCFLFFFLIIDLYFLIPALTTQIFYPFAELIIPIYISTKEAKAEMETHPVTVEIDISKGLI